MDRFTTGLGGFGGLRLIGWPECVRSAGVGAAEVGAAEGTLRATVVTSRSVGSVERVAT